MLVPPVGKLLLYIGRETQPISSLALEFSKYYAYFGGHPQT